MASTILIGRDSGGLLMLNRETLDSLFKQSPIDNMEVAVVGVIGAPKSGKSFLLNYIMRYFRNEGKGVLNWMKDKNPQKPLQGFPWNCLTETSEQVCIWSEAFTVEKEIDQKKIAVFLMEFGGAENVLPQYQALALRTCSLLIFNEVQTISNSTLSNLIFIFKTFLDTNEKLTFPYIAFLVRDAMPEYRKSAEKEAKAYLKETFQKLSPARLNVDISDIMKKWIFAFLPVPAFNNSDQCSPFRGEFSALGKSFHQPFGEFISEVLDNSESICFNPTSAVRMHGEMYANHFRNQHNRAQYQDLECLRQFRSSFDSSEPMEIDTSPTDVNSIHQKDEDEPMDAEATFVCLHKPKPLTMSKVTQHELDISFASSSSETSFNTPTRTFTEANFNRSSVSSNSTPEKLPEEPLVSHISVLEVRLASNSSKSSNFPNSISSVVPNDTSIDVSPDSEKATGKLVPEVSNSVKTGPFETRKKSCDTLPGYKAASAILDSSVSLSNEEKSEQEQIRANLNGGLTKSSSTTSEAVAKTVHVEGDQQKNVPTIISRTPNAVSKGKLDNDAAEIVDVEALIKKSLKTFNDEFKMFLDKEIDLNKLKEKHSELELKCVSSFKALGSAKEEKFNSGIEDAAKQLKLDINEHLNAIVKQHDEDCFRVTQLITDYERVYTESVKAALQYFFDKTQGPNMNSIINQSKSKAEATLRGHEFGKFRSIYTKRITEEMENVNKSAKLVETLVSNFHSQMDKKISMYTYLSDKEFQKHQTEFKSQAMKEFGDCKDPDFRSILESQLRNISQHLETRNREIRRCEEKVAGYAVAQLKEFYYVQMQQFCHKKVHTSHAIREFHAKLRNATFEYFTTVCKFNTVSGIDNGKYTASLETCCNKMLEGFLTTNSIQVMKASQTVAKANSKAKAEYNKLMGEKLGDKSVPQNQLNQYHEKTLTEVLLIFKLNIQQIAENCDEEINSLRDNINRTSRKEWQEENEERRQRESKKAEVEKLIMEKQMAEREEEARIQAEAKKRRQLEASQKEQEKNNNCNVRPTSGPSYAQVPGTTTQAIAIELGLKFIQAGWMHPQNGAVPIPLERQSLLLPSTIAVNGSNDVVFGTEAEACKQQIRLADIVTDMNVASSYSLFVQEKEVQLSFEELTALVLAQVKETCEKSIGSSVTRAVITIPSWYNQQLRRATKHAAFLAGFVENRLISEASAVAINWFKHNKQLLKLNPRGSAKLLVAVASDFSFDVAGFEVEDNSLSMKKMVGRMNVCLGIRNSVRKFVTKWWTGSTEVDPDTIVNKACSFLTSHKKVHHAVFVETAGYTGSLNSTCLNKYSLGSVTSCNSPILGAALFSAFIGPQKALELKEVATYSLYWKDWNNGGNELICETSEFLFTHDSRNYEAKLHGSIDARTRISVTIMEKVNDVDKYLGTVYIEPPCVEDEKKKLKLIFRISPEGIMSAEAKYGTTVAGVKFTADYRNDLLTSKKLISELLGTEKKIKALQDLQEALQNLRSIEETLRKSICSSTKILEILKPEIMKNIGSIVDPIMDSSSSSLAVVEAAVAKLTKYSKIYIKDEIL